MKALTNTQTFFFIRKEIISNATAITHSNHKVWLATGIQSIR